MLTSAEFDLVLPKDKSINQSMGSAFHGALMEIVGSKVAEELHGVGVRPFSQYVYYNKRRNKFCWRVSTLNNKAREDILEPLMCYNKPLLLQQKGYTVEFERREILRETTFEEIADSIFLLPTVMRTAKISFVTATGFKSAGQYVNFPSANLIFQSLYNRWNAFSEGIVLDDAEVFKQLAEYTQILGYHLNMHRFYVGDGKIASFQGDLELSLLGNEVIKRIGAMLLEFGNFSGIGIKTALGMGGTKIIIKTGKEHLVNGL